MTLSIAPTVYFFLLKDVAFGLTGLVTYNNTSQGTTSASSSGFGVAPIFAFNLWLGESLSLVPGFSVAVTSRDLTATTSGNNPRLTTVSLQVAAPLLFHPARHFFIGFGPVFSYDVAASLSNATGDAPKTTSIGAQSYVGGYF
jgi:hypothetical protein